MKTNCKITILPQARQDLQDVFDWYEKKSSGLGKRFLTEVEIKIRFIQQLPFASNIKYEAVHTAPVNTFPFLIHYIFDNTRDTILIIAILHTRLNPKKWKVRRKAGR